jgi:hypothetical protein
VKRTLMEAATVSSRTISKILQPHVLRTSTFFSVFFALLSPSDRFLEFFYYGSVITVKRYGSPEKSKSLVKSCKRVFRYLKAEFPVTSSQLKPADMRL